MWKINLKKSNITNFIFYLTYSLICFNYISSSVLFMKNYHNLLAFFSMLFLLLTFILQSNKYKKNSLLFILIAILLGFFSYIFSGDNAFLIMVLLIISAKRINFDKVVKFDLIIKIIFVLFVLLLYKYGGTEYIFRYRDDGTKRLAMGFGHPNVFGAYLFYICMCICNLKYKNMKIKDYIILLICLYVSHFICNSRSSEISILLLIIFSFFSNCFEKIIFKRKILKYLPFVCFIISILLSQLYLYNNCIALFLDNLLNKRIYYSAIVSKNVGLSLFGYNLSNIVTYGLDNAYLNIFYQYGIFAAILLFYCIFRVIIYAQKKYDFKLLMSMFVILIYAIMEKFSFHIEYNVFLLTISNLIFFKLESSDERDDFND